MELTGTRFTTSATGGWSVQHRLPGHPSKQGLPRAAECQLPAASPPRPALLGALPTEGPCPLFHRPSGQVPTRLADAVTEACDTLHTVKKETCLLSTAGTIHGNFLPWPPSRFQVISNDRAPKGEGEPNAGTVRSLLKTQNTLPTDGTGVGNSGETTGSGVCWDSGVATLESHLGLSRDPRGRCSLRHFSLNPHKVGGRKTYYSENSTPKFICTLQRDPRLGLKALASHPSFVS